MVSTIPILGLGRQQFLILFNWNAAGMALHYSETLNQQFIPFGGIVPGCCQVNDLLDATKLEIPQYPPEPPGPSQPRGMGGPPPQRA